MAEIEIKGGAGPYEAAAIVAVFNRLRTEATAARADRPKLPRPPAWVRAYLPAHPDDPMPDVVPDSRGNAR
ncbi:MAG: hypothetical protein ACRDWH_08740 [Acidimicrobiia bacterium]